ncbi:MAG: thioredoxin [Planctomycetota bacterium]
MTNTQNLPAAVTFDRQSLQQQLQAGGVTLVDFYADWCGPCRALAPTVDAVARRYQGKATIGKLDIDQNQELAGQLGVSSIPTLIVFRDGQPVDRLVGMQSADVVADKLDSWL